MGEMRASDVGDPFEVAEMRPRMSERRHMVDGDPFEVGENAASDVGTQAHGERMAHGAHRGMVWSHGAHR